MKTRQLPRLVGNRKGATLIFVALAMVVLLGMAALAIDVGYLYVIRGELQNAADSGALAGAQVLYNDLGTEVNVGAPAVAIDYVERHVSEQATVAVESAKFGHWSFANRTFTAYPDQDDPPPPPNLWDRSTEELDGDVNFINAVQVITTRTTDATTGRPEPPFFARVFGASAPIVRAVAVGYIGFAGTLEPNEADQPVAICKQALLASGEYTCSVGRMINSGQNPGSTTGQSGGWTNFTQPCDTASTPTVRPLICSSGNPDIVTLGAGIGTVGGELQTAADSLMDCWLNHPGLDTDTDGLPDQPWELKLPVIDCPSNNVSPCSTVVGAVVVNVIWITRNDKNQMNEVPRKMGDWTCTAGADGATCWNEFVQHFNLENMDGGDATYEDKTIYFLPDCEPQIPTGITGGENFGVLAKVPVLVK